GSRYFDIQNGAGDSAPDAQGVADNPGIPLSQVAGGYPGAIQVQKGFRENGFQTLYPDSSGQMAIEIKELMRLEIDLTAGKRDEAKWWGFLKVGDSLRKLPAGSGLDSDQGIFYWTPGPGFIGTYDLVFIKRHKTGVLKKRELTIKIIPKF
ncbi:MAG TPA: Ig domain-containing protein, partial [Candidatus Kapabacteria bacterium]|nr:Ig domain-containing protein [Candidatus Kapabacteria bacterium]